MNDLREKLGKELLFFDGAMGSLLQAQGLLPGELPELWNLRFPEKICEIHTAYLNAGADILKSNTFGANCCKLADSGHSVQEVIFQGITLAKKAVSNVGHGWVALDIGPTGKLLEPLGDLAFEAAVEIFQEMISAGTEAGADCILIETMADIYEAKAALLAAKENSTLPVFVTMTFDETGKLLTGGNLSVMAAVLEGLGADAIGLNCGLGPEQMVAFTKSLRAFTDLPILVNPNAGLPKEENGKTVYEISPEEFSLHMEAIVQAGAQAVGGCCGTTPEHIAAMVRQCKGLPCQTLSPTYRTVITSGSRAVEFGTLPVLIGERINPTGKSRFKQALREHDIPYLLQEGITQQDAGAHVLDVNVGLPEIDEPALMCEVVQELQAVSPLPLQLDTSDPETMERAMRLYNGKPLVNSVTAKAASMEAIFPLVKKYGGVVIGLTITEDGIPETAEGRLEAAKIIVDTATQYGIRKKDIVIDPLTMAISAEQDAALVTLKALCLIRRELGVFTSLGVSNVSFGLPQRENITSSFFLMALQSGLSAAILNPKSEMMMRVYRSYCALSGLDKSCMGYIAAYAQAEQSPPLSAPSQDPQELGAAIEKGLKEAAFLAAEKMIRNGTDGLELINSHIVPALDAVGEKFEKKVLFLPQLLMSAEAAKAAFEAIKRQLGQKDSAPQKKSQFTVVIATVKGDVHDIGKNIVKVLLENYGFHVIDLGKDVSSEVVLEAVLREHAELVGLSALMTTTVVNMKETITVLREKAPFCKIMVGGAVLTQEYADRIGADFYGKDAMASVRYATELKNLTDSSLQV
ncbi:homocysteine S-methyltransferase family protein [Neglectibacter caecimuris]|uniref:homocysteine S-methyltransferase family protein n=1 Tax=Neglectibacter caecimuris TaxID=3093658 RepID=UPI002AC91085|nr:homocysteine S-methyltransferase family protein [Neglectibacter sp. M00184]